MWCEALAEFILISGLHRATMDGGEALMVWHVDKETSSFKTVDDILEYRFFLQAGKGNTVPYLAA